jgi:hypothetical protein
MENSKDYNIAVKMIDKYDETVIFIVVTNLHPQGE